MQIFILEINSRQDCSPLSHTSLQSRVKAHIKYHTLKCVNGGIFADDTPTFISLNAK